MSQSFKLATRATKLQFVTLIITLAGIGLQSCGNSWVTAGDREKTPSARMLKAQFLYDKGNFEAAAEIYQQILQEDPSNDGARIRLAYSLNGLAGLAPLGILTKLSQVSSGSKTTPQAGAAAGSTKTSSSSGLNTLTAIAGISKEEQAAVLKAGPKTYDELTKADTLYASKFASDAKGLKSLKSVVTKLKFLQASWEVNCRLIPAKVLTAVIGSNQIRKKYMKPELCLGGYPSSYQDPAVIFASAMESMSHGSILFQTKLDANGDGKIDAVETASLLTKDIASLQSSAASFTSADKINEQVASLNTKIEQLKEIGDTLGSEMVDLTMAHFEVMALLLTAIQGVLPENVSKTLINSIKKFEEAKTKVSGYVKTGAGTGKSSGTQTQISTNAAKATEAADKYFENFQKSCNGTCSEQTKFEENFGATCSQFDSLKTSYGLPADAQKPKNCSGAAALFFIGTQTESSEGPGSFVQETTQNIENFSFDDLKKSETPEDSLEHLVEFVQIGHSFLN